MALDSARAATARGAAVAFMKVCEKCAPSLVALGAGAYAKALQVFKDGGPARGPLRLLRQVCHALFSCLRLY